MDIQLCDIKCCTQCHACELVCPKQCVSFRSAECGFQVPVINPDHCIKCGLCLKSCHQINEPKRQRLSSPIAYAAWSKDDSLRAKSSSGGVFSVLAEMIISKGGVVYGAIMTKDLQVIHSCAETIEQLSDMRGSKYVQSNLEGIYRKVNDHLLDSKPVLFTGTPCQVAGLYAFLKKPYPCLITCDLVCHGVPSQDAFDVYCEKIGLKHSNVEGVSFRYTQGWGLRMAFKSPSRKEPHKLRALSPIKSYYLKAFTKGLMFNEACYSCKYARTERMGDFTLADFWGIGGAAPFNHSTKKGVSLLLINTEIGLKLLSSCNGLFIEERPLEEAVQGNHNLRKASERPSERDTYFEDSHTMSIRALLKKYSIHPSWRDYLRPIKRLLNI